MKRANFIAGLMAAVLMVMGLGSFAPVAAQTVHPDIGDQLSHAAGPQGAGYGNPVDPRTMVVTIIRVLLSLIGTVLFVYIFYAGFLWMTAAGSSEQVEKATGIIKNSVIGLIIILSSYVITIAAANISRGLPISYGTGWGHFIGSWF